MRMPEKLERAFNDQVDMELYSSAAYLQMAIYFSDCNLTGMSDWMRAQAEEERNHALRFLDFLLDRGNRAELGAVERPNAQFSSAEEVFATALEQEQRVTEAIHSLYRLATEEGDLASFPFLQDFLGEQNEEEATVETILDRIRLAGDDSGALLILDNQLGARSPDGH